MKFDYEVEKKAENLLATFGLNCEFFTRKAAYDAIFTMLGKWLRNTQCIETFRFELCMCYRTKESHREPSRNVV